ncbi:MAG: MarR family transcriptional regulator [Candidatus Muirbacterium halophilum]|nr:MarR family transcriptional regulator [Candidatus Muirbacterium halophilum]
MTKIIGKYISIISRNKKAYFKKHLAHLDIGEGQYIILIQLFKNSTLTQEQLAEILVANKATITRALQCLNKKGFVNVKKNVVDRRENIITLTEKAYSIKDEFYSIIRNWNKKLIEDFDELEQQRLFEFLEKLTDKAIFMNKGISKHGKT